MRRLNISKMEPFAPGIREVRVESVYETMVNSGIKEESVYYESFHELPLIANTIARKKLYEMNRIIFDTAEYGCYLFDHECRPFDFMKNRTRT